jgi:hypothetical protein
MCWRIIAIISCMDATHDTVSSAARCPWTVSDTPLSAVTTAPPHQPIIATTVTPISVAILLIVDPLAGAGRRARQVCHRDGTAHPLGPKQAVLERTVIAASSRPHRSLQPWRRPGHVPVVMIGKALRRRTP